MTIYFVLYFLIAMIALVAYAGSIKDRYKKLLCTWSVFFLAFLVLALRHETMGKDLLGYKFGDRIGYLVTYDAIYKASWKEAFTETFVNYERGFILYCKVVSTLTKGDHQLFLALTALLSLAPIAFLIYRRSETPALSWVIYLGLPMFLLLYSGLRQGMALGLCALALLAVQDRKPIPFVLLVILAGFFHQSALLFLIAYPIYYVRMNTATRVCSLLLIIGVFVLRSFFFEILSKLVKANAVMDENNSITLFLVLLAIYLFCSIFTDNSEAQSGLLNIFMLACVCQAFGGVYNLALRVGYYFLMALVPLLPNVIAKLRTAQDRVLSTLAITGCFGAFGLYSIATTVWAEAAPYHFFFEQISGV